MKTIRYSKYTGEDLGIGAEELLQALSDFLLESGFNTQYMPFSEWNQQTLEDLKRAIQEALEQGKLFDDESMQEMMERLQTMSPEQMDKLLERLVQKMVDEGQITIEEPGDPKAGQGGVGSGKDSKVRFEVTDKSLDFLGFKTLKDLLGSLGKSSFGRHDTRDLATGIETSGSSKQYEFGDTLNLDISETLFSAIRREGAKVPLDMDYFGSARAPVRVSELLRHGADAGLQPQHDPVRRGPLHAGQEGRAGAGAPDSHAVSRRQPALRAVPRQRRGTGRSANWRACRWARTTPTRATASFWRRSC